jgi:predicted RNase H-like HicB family nuclease
MEEKGLDPDSEGTYIPAKGRKSAEIIINRDLAKEMRSLGAGIHEVIHHILKNSLKDPTTGKISKEGKAIIKEFLEGLSKKDRAMVEKRVVENYKNQIWTAKEYKKYKEKVKTAKKQEDGTYKVEIKKEYYLEEYITAYGQGLKERQAKYNEGTMKKISKLFYPILKPIFPSLYEIEGITSIKAGKDLQKMLENIYSVSELMVKKKLTKAEEIKEIEKLKIVEDRVVKGKSAHSKKKVNTKIDDLLKDPIKTKATVEKNTTLEKQVIENAKKAGLETVKHKEYGEVIVDKSRAKEFVTQEIKMR